ncbi:MAG TPA: DNA-binding response regulator [Cytophagales bacterium]|nr:DNA-binding response regulator [Cytophagales bacterium]HAA23005.1 DNA-binding response regulator [Cytophagales bacterium]HAP64316.1 DNA-binding response regulator [Cytophagales bacterium]
MKPLRILIVDDEPLAHKVLEGYLEKMPEVVLAGNCYDGISTHNFLQNHTVDLILLDIQMPDITGLELLDILQQSAPKIIFTTAHTEYALQSFNYDQVVDYLHKPIRVSRFMKAMDRVRKQLVLEQDFEQRAETMPPAAAQSSPTYLSFKDNKVIHKVPISDILYIQSWGNYLKVFLENEDMKMMRMPIKSIEQELEGTGFERIHKSYLVNSRKVTSIEGNQVRLPGDILLPIGKSYALTAKRNITKRG